MNENINDTDAMSTTSILSSINKDLLDSSQQFSTNSAENAIGLVRDSLSSLDEDTITIEKFDLGRSFYLLGKVHYDKADLLLAEKYFKEAISLSKKPRDVFTIFKVYGFLIRISSERMETKKALEYIRESSDLLAEFPLISPSLTGEYFYNQGIINNYRGEFEDAKTSFILSLKKARKQNEPGLSSKCLLALSVNAYNTQNYPEALKYLQNLSDLLTILDKSYLKGAMHLFFAKVYIELEDYKKACAHFDYANLKLQEKKCWNMYGYLLLGKGIIAKKTGKFSLAKTYFDLAKNAVDPSVFKRLRKICDQRIEELNDSNIDIYLDKINRKVKESVIGLIDFKHRFILLDILFLLAKNQGKHFDKYELTKEIWKDEYNPLIHDKLIYTSVSRLRKLIEPKNDRNVRKKYIIRDKDGYTFNSDVKIRFCLENENEIDIPSIANVEITSPV